MGIPAAPEDATSGKKTYVLKLNSHGGDVLMARPVLRAFRRAHPRDSIYFEVKPEFLDLMAGQRDAEFVWPFGKAKKGMGVHIDLCDFSRKDFARARVHIMDAMARAAGVEVVDRSYGLIPTADVDRWAKGEVEKFGGPFAAFHAMSMLPSKDWPADRLAAVAAALKEKHGLIPVQFGGNEDPPIEGAVDLRGVHGLLRSSAIMSRAAIFVGPDSLPMHMSRAVRDVPAVVLWGATSPITSGLFGPSVINLDPQRFCGHDGNPCMTRCDWTEPCVSRTSVQEAVEACSRLLDPAGTKRPDVTVVLVNWNSWAKYTRRTIYALERTMKSDWDMVIVDNGSPVDGPFVADFKHSRLAASIAWPENRGLPAAWNAAIRVARGRVFLFLNTDVDLLEEGWDLQALAAMAARPGCGILGVSKNEPPLFFGEAWSRQEVPGWGPGVVTRAHHVNGSCLFVRRSTLDRVGPFDERYTPGYCEETDYCLRAGLMGEEIWHLGGLVEHEGHGVTAKLNHMKISEHVKNNSAYFARKWAGVTPPAVPGYVPPSPPAQAAPPARAAAALQTSPESPERAAPAAPVTPQSRYVPLFMPPIAGVAKPAPPAGAPSMAGMPTRAAQPGVPGTAP